MKFKPVAAHAEDMMRIKQKKEGAKTVRADRNVLMQALFHAFEKHQYYRFDVWCCYADERGPNLVISDCRICSS